MTKTVKLFLITLLMFLAGCASKSVSSKTEANGSPQVLPGNKPLENGLVDDSVWIVQAGLQGDAGLFAKEEPLAIKSLKMNVDIIEFLANVDVLLSYPQVQSQQELAFKYPTFNGVIVRDFSIRVGQRKFRAVIAKAESAEEIFKVAKEQNFNTALISQKAFSEVIAKLSLTMKADVEVDFKYTQLTSVADGQRVFSLPAFKGLQKNALDMNVSGQFSTNLESFTGLGKEVKGQNFKRHISDEKVLENGLMLKYKVNDLATLSADKKVGLAWDESAQDYKINTLKKGQRFMYCEPDTLKAVSSYLNFRKMLRERKPFKAIQEYALQSKLLSRLTRLLLVDSTK